VYFGLQPFGTVEVEAPVRNVYARWSRAPQIGSIRLNVLELGLAEGDHVLLRFGVDHAFEFIGLRRSDIEAADPLRRLRMLAGSTDPTDRRPWPEVLAGALGMSPGDSVVTSDLMRLLADRKQHELIELVAELENTEPPG